MNKSMFMHIVTIAVREIMHACIRNYIVKYRYSARLPLTKEVNLVSNFLLCEKNLKTLSELHDKGM